jgi:hypothetical protein
MGDNDDDDLDTDTVKLDFKVAEDNVDVDVVGFAVDGVEIRGEETEAGDNDDGTDEFAFSVIISDDDDEDADEGEDTFALFESLDESERMSSLWLLVEPVLTVVKSDNWRLFIRRLASCLIRSMSSLSLWCC